MFRAEIQTRWVGDGQDEANDNRPAWGDNFKYRSWQDVTGQEPYAGPNLYTLLVEAEQDQILLTEDSPNFWVNWAESIPESEQEVPAAIPDTDIPISGAEPSQERHDAMRAWQMGRGLTQGEVDATLGAAPAGRSASDIGRALAVAQRQMPPGTPPFPYLLTLQVEREPGWQGNLGWKVTLHDWAQDAAPASTAMGVYAKPDADGYLYTTGAFQELEPDVWGAVCPPGQEPGDADVYFGVLYGAAIVGAFTLPQGRQKMRFRVNGKTAQAQSRARSSNRRKR